MKLIVGRDFVVDGKLNKKKSEQYLRSPKKNFTTENFFGVSDAEFCADFSDTTHWAETGSKKNAPKKTAQNGLK